MVGLDRPRNTASKSVSHRTARSYLLAALCVALFETQGCAHQSTVSRSEHPEYPLCPEPFERRLVADEHSIADLCGGFDKAGRLVDGWEVTIQSDGVRREEHWARGKLNGFFRVWFDDGDSWIGYYVDGAL